MAAMTIGDWAKADELFEQARQTAQGIDDPLAKARSLHGLAGLLGMLRARTTGATLIEEARQMAERIDDPKERAWVMRDLAETAAALGVQTKAAALIEEARQAAERIGDPWDKARTLGTLAEAAMKIRDPAKANELYEQARQTLKGIGLDRDRLLLPDPRDITWLFRDHDRDLVEELARAGHWRRARREAERYIADDHRAMALARILEVWAERRNPALAEVREEKE